MCRWKRENRFNVYTLLDVLGECMFVLAASPTNRLGRMCFRFWGNEHMKDDFRSLPTTLHTDPVSLAKLLQTSSHLSPQASHQLIVVV